MQPKKAFQVFAISLIITNLTVAHGAEKDALVDPAGTVHVSPFRIPFSSLASSEAKAAFIKQAEKVTVLSQENASKAEQSEAGKIDIEEFRREADAFVHPIAEAAEKVYPVIITPKIIGGVPAEVVTPRDGVAKMNRQRVLIDLHGGAFLWSGREVREVESMPIASIGKIEVISVDYRLGPEHKFPAASEDAAGVYKELLKNHAPENIGIYGCSAGGILTGQAIAWFDSKGLPLPGAVGVLCASLSPFSVGDSNYWVPHLLGEVGSDAEEGKFVDGGLYFGAADPSDPLVDPQNSLALLAKFPPTLFITGTRSRELSGSVHSHIQLVGAGVRAELYVWDGMLHGFWADPRLPESKQAVQVIVDFFNRHLGERRRLP